VTCLNLLQAVQNWNMKACNILLSYPHRDIF